MEMPLIFLVIILVAGYFLVRSKQNADAEAFLRNIKAQFEAENEFKCPSCSSNHFNSGTRGWHWKTGLRGSSKIILTCLNCGDKWEPVFKTHTTQ